MLYNRRRVTQQDGSGELGMEGGVEMVSGAAEADSAAFDDRTTNGKKETATQDTV